MPNPFIRSEADELLALTPAAAEIAADRAFALVRDLETDADRAITLRLAGLTCREIAALWPALELRIALAKLPEMRRAG